MQGQAALHALLADQRQGLVHDQDRVVDRRADQDHEAEHRQDVHLLPGHHMGEAQGGDAADAGQRHRDHDDDRVQEALEQGRQQNA
ncbi:MAG: hypothetical protein R3F30_03330 [Planctomycetota bacterium]